MHRFFTGSINEYEKSISITGEDVNHIKNVLRLSVGDEVIISDGRGRDYISTLSSISDGEVVADIVDICDTAAELPADITLFQGVPKGDKMELIIQKAVELGAYQIIPVAMKRSVVKLDEKKAQNKIKRWQAIAESAAKQSKRGIIPNVHMPVTMKEALEIAKDLDVKLLPYEQAEGMEYTRKVISQIKPGESIGIFVGPEGGFDDKEVEAATNAGFKSITIGKRILRTETAGFTMLSWLLYTLER
jgi:16S rRNA (uracil1498-N3)-methyltransferase